MSQPVQNQESVVTTPVEATTKKRKQRSDLGKKRGPRKVKAKVEN